MRKAYSENPATESGFGSASNIKHIALPVSFDNASLKLNRFGTMGNIIPMKEDKATASYRD